MQRIFVRFVPHTETDLLAAGDEVYPSLTGVELAEDRTRDTGNRTWSEYKFVGVI